MLEDLKLRPQYDGLIYLGDASRGPPIIKPHRHVELELNVVAHGSITYVVDGRRLTFGKRTLLWLYPTQVHQMIDRSGDAQFYVAVFKPELITQACKGEAYAGLRTVPGRLTGVMHTELAPESFDTICRTMRSVMDGGPDPDVLNREAGFGPGSRFQFEHDDPDWLNSGLRHLLLLCWRNQRGRVGRSRPVALHPAVRKALKLIAGDSDSESLDDLAERCGVSPAYLSRTFAHQVGMPVTQYRNWVRLGRFWDYYRRPEGSTVTGAVYAAGFGSYPQFYKVFVSAYGRGPRECLKDPGAGETANELPGELPGETAIGLTAPAPERQIAKGPIHRVST